MPEAKNALDIAGGVDYCPALLLIWTCFISIQALVAQLDRALDYESRGREFESSRARHFPIAVNFLQKPLSP